MKSLRSFLSECSGSEFSNASKFFHKIKDDEKLKDWIIKRQEEIETGKLHINEAIAYYDYLVSILPKGINSAESNNFVSDFKLDELEILYDYLGEIPASLLKEDPNVPTKWINISEDRENIEKRKLIGKRPKHKKWKGRDLGKYSDSIISEGIPSIDSPFKRAESLLNSDDEKISSKEFSGKLGRRKYYEEKKAALELISNIINSSNLANTLNNFLLDEKNDFDETGSLRPADWDSIYSQMDELTNEGYSANEASKIVEERINGVRRAGTIRNKYKGYL